jgi:hypothetical protein
MKKAASKKAARATKKALAMSVPRPPDYDVGYEAGQRDALKSVVLSNVHGALEANEDYARARKRGDVAGAAEYSVKACTLVELVVESFNDFGRL